MLSSAPLKSTVVVEQAESTADLMANFRGRHRVFVGEGICGVGVDGCLVDPFDALPVSYHAIARFEGRVVGGCRATIASSAGLPSERFFDFVPWFSSPPAACASGSYLWVDREFRRGTLGLKLVRACTDWGRTRGVREIGAPIRPEAVPLFERLGWRQIAPQFDHPVEGAPVVPMIGSVR